MHFLAAACAQLHKGEEGEVSWEEGDHPKLNIHKGVLPSLLC